MRLDCVIQLAQAPLALLLVPQGSSAGGVTLGSASRCRDSAKGHRAPISYRRDDAGGRAPVHTRIPMNPAIGFRSRRIYHLQMGAGMATRTSSCNCGQLRLTHEGPDPERISLCQCYECQKRTGSVLSAQARIPRDDVTIEGQSTTWTFPLEGGKPAAFRSCDSGGATYHSGPECGSTLYWDISLAPELIGVASAPSPTRRFRRQVFRVQLWAPVGDAPLRPSEPHYDYDGTEHGGARV